MSAERPERDKQVREIVRPHGQLGAVYFCGDGLRVGGAAVLGAPSGSAVAPPRVSTEPQPCWHSQAGAGPQLGAAGPLGTPHVLDLPQPPGAVRETGGGAARGAATGGRGRGWRCRSWRGLREGRPRGAKGAAVAAATRSKQRGGGWAQVGAVAGRSPHHFPPPRCWRAGRGVLGLGWRPRLPPAGSGRVRDGDWAWAHPGQLQAHGVCPPPPPPSGTDTGTQMSGHTHRVTGVHTHKGTSTQTSPQTCIGVQTPLSDGRRFTCTHIRSQRRTHAYPLSLFFSVDNPPRQAQMPTLAQAYTCLERQRCTCIHTHRGTGTYT